MPQRCSVARASGGERHDDPQLALTRVFDALRALVYQALTDPTTWRRDESPEFEELVAKFLAVTPQGAAEAVGAGHQHTH